MSIRRAELEASVRCLVADRLGVDVDELAPDVSLVDDLAADSLDFVEIAIAIEGELGVSVPQRLLDDVRTCGDLVHATLEVARGAPARRDEPTRVVVRARVAGPVGALERVVALTPYAIQTIAEDARRMGRGAVLELTLLASADDVALVWVERRFSALSAHGIQVKVRRERQLVARTRASPG